MVGGDPCVMRSLIAALMLIEIRNQAVLSENDSNTDKIFVSMSSHVEAATFRI